MTNEQFIDKALKLVEDYTAEHSGAADKDFYAFVVWSCKTLQNYKAILSTTIHDQMIYEVTYNGDNDEIYFDAYKKQINRCIKVTDNG